MTNEELIKMLTRIEKKLDRIERKLEHFQSIPVKTHLKTKEACEYMSACPNNLKKICAEFGINPKPIGGAKYYKVSDLESVFS